MLNPTSMCAIFTSTLLSLIPTCETKVKVKATDPTTGATGEVEVGVKKDTATGQITGQLPPKTQQQTITVRSPRGQVWSFDIGPNDSCTESLPYKATCTDPIIAQIPSSWVRRDDIADDAERNRGCGRSNRFVRGSRVGRHARRDPTQ